jgi:hypothetical protein
MVKLLNTLRNQRLNDRSARIYRDLIRKEAKIGGQLFGPVKPGGRREFFCLDERTWIWHEEWIDEPTARLYVVTTRYDVRPNGILKSQNSQPTRYIDLSEAKNFLSAIRLYNYRVKTELYQSVA